MGGGKLMASMIIEMNFVASYVKKKNISGTIARLLRFHEGKLEEYYLAFGIFYPTT